VVDGNLEGLYFGTGGVARQQRDLQLLVDKFGAPATTTQPIVQNGYGATAQAVTATWVTADGVIVTFASAANRIDSGNVWIETAKGAAARAAVSAALHKASPAL